jgi:hypothetical protein
MNDEKTTTHQQPLSARINGRGTRLFRGSLLIFALVVLATTSCTKESKPQEVADRFMELYYSRPNMAEAVKLCSGAAKTKLESQLQAIKGVAPDSSAAEPRVNYDLTGNTNPTANSATFTYRVTARTADVGSVVATLGLSNEDGRWMITSFSEQEAPPKS